MHIGVFARVTAEGLAIVDLARALEERGLESLWVGEHTHTPVATEPDGYHDATMVEISKDFPSPFVLLAAAAAVTKRLRLGTSVCLVAEHDPLVLAKEVATLDVVSGGRVELGCGYGWNRAEMENHGVDPRRRRAALREKLRAVELLWEQDTAAFAGEFVSFSESWSRPKPVQRPRPPVLMGAPARPGVFQDVVELADGWMPSGYFAGEGLAAQLAELRRVADVAGRSPEDLLITLLESRAAVSRVSVDEFIDSCPDLDRLRLLADLGVHRVVVGVPASDRGATLPMLDQLASLASRCDGAV